MNKYKPSYAEAPHEIRNWKYGYPIHDLDHYWWFTDDGFDIDGITHWQPIVLPKKEKK